MSVLAELETKLKTFVEDAVREAESHEQAIDAAVYQAATAAGVPAAWAQSLADGVKMAIDHFSQDHAPAAPAAPEQPQEPEAPGEPVQGQPV